MSVAADLLWYDVYRRLMNRKNGPMVPDQIRELTLPELSIALDDDMEKPRPAGGGVQMGHEERCLWIAWRRHMTPEQKLAAAQGRLPVREQLELAMGDGPWHKKSSPRP